MLTQAQSLQALADVAAEGRRAVFIKASKATSIGSVSTVYDDIDVLSVDSDFEEDGDDLLGIDSDFEEDEDEGIDLLGDDSDVSIEEGRNDVREHEKNKGQRHQSFSDNRPSQLKTVGSDKRRKASSMQNFAAFFSEEGSKSTHERRSRRSRTQRVDNEGNHSLARDSNHQTKSPSSHRKQVRRSRSLKGSRASPGSKQIQRTRTLKGSPATSRSPRRPVSRQVSEGCRSRRPAGDDLLRSQTTHSKIRDETEDIGQDPPNRLRASAGTGERREHRARQRTAGCVSPISGSHHESTGKGSPEGGLGSSISPCSRSSRMRGTYKSLVANQMALLVTSVEDLDDEADSEDVDDVPEFAEEGQEDTQYQDATHKEPGLLRVSTLLAPARSAAKIATKAMNKSGQLAASAAVITAEKGAKLASTAVVKSGKLAITAANTTGKVVNKSGRLAKSGFDVVKERTENMISGAAGYENASEMAPKAA